MTIAHLNNRTDLQADSKVGLIHLQRFFSLENSTNKPDCVDLIAKMEQH